ncbi:CBO0543 family protein [Orenia marismortui]|uniref:CBO0543 family protein n=1 Tax=Orenia marismortui TaxID=46469 RepID=UPI000368A1B8|nr:CBO0543 family protein [Orenia marismortui]
MNQKAFEEIIRLNKMIDNVAQEYWLKSVLYTPQWWLLIFMLLIPFFILWKLIDRNRLQEVLLYVSLMSLISIILDWIGLQMILWAYPYQLFPATHPLLNPFNLSFLPITYALVYQYFYKWKQFLIALIISSFIASFVLEPLFTKVGIYVLINWKYYYSFPIYVGMGIGMKYFVDRVGLVE